MSCSVYYHSLYHSAAHKIYLKYIYCIKKQHCEGAANIHQVLFLVQYTIPYIRYIKYMSFFCLISVGSLYLVVVFPALSSGLCLNRTP